jgi:glucokinase
VVLDGRIYQGASGVSNHVGHIVVDPKGPKAATGNRGILEMYPSTIGITRMAKEARLKVPPGGSYDPKTVVAMARKGNLAAKRILVTAGQMLGVGLTSAIHIINPSVVIFSGGVSQAGELLFRPMRRELRERCFKSHLKGLKFRMARLGDNMGAVGAARLAWQSLDAEA